MNKRKIVLNLAISLDWYIADDDWWFDWIIGDGDNTNDTNNQIDFNDFLETVDTLVMWRKAYNDCPTETMEFLNNKKIFIATHTNVKNITNNIKCISGNISEQILKEQKLPWKDIYIWWWALVADDFIKSDIIDEYIIGIIPVILGKWRPLFLDNNPNIKLHLLESTSKEWIVILKYEKRKEV
jgi:dihydrofolate reductase